MIPEQCNPRELGNVVKEAGKLLLLYWGKNMGRMQKEDGSLVTEADFISEKFLIASLHQLFPLAGFWSEESGKSGNIESAYKWVIDPLDGTRNFAMRIPYFCVSVALTYKDIPIVAALYEPILDTFFYAAKGKGAYCNGERMSVSSLSSFAESCIAFGLSSVHAKRLEVIKVAEKMAIAVAAVRHTGAVALDLAHVACGNFDGIIVAYLSWWDIAAGILLVEEAGGMVSDIKGEVLGPGFIGCIGGSPIVYKELRRLFGGN